MKYRFFHWFLPVVKEEHLGDENHPHGRRFRKEYKKKQNVVKNIWVASGVAMLCFPTPAFIVSLGLATTFLAFLILDETS